MAQFKIDLLTPSVVETTNNEFNFSTPYLVTRISEFYKQTDEFNSKQPDELNNIVWTQQQNTYTFTFDEKVSFHKNAQKELTFSMLRNVWVENEFVVNPFVSALHVGAQLLLTDKDGNEHIFTVKNVNYTPTSENMLYAYTCQDSFSYQGARQNAGYTIENDSTSEDFIGAENIDFWANKIKEECHIGYKYLGLKDNLWIGQDGNIHTGAISSLNKIIKHAYNETDHKDYFATIPFSVSGSSASAALISLAEQLGFMLNVCEKTEKGSDGRIYIDSYFWLEPEKHEQVSGLKYSPYSSIQSFTFSHAGESLSTVLNVESNTFDDELITLLPDVPEFFIEYFESDEWRNSSFYDGMFTDVCQGKIFKSNGNIGSDFNIEGMWLQDGCLYFTLSNFIIPSFYNSFKFEDSFKESEFYLNTVRHTPYLSEWGFGFFDDGDMWVEVSGEGLIQKVKNETLYLRVKPLSAAGASNEKLDIAHLDLIFNFYRNATQDELDFAAIADKCPWLENKLIDFSYFLENKVINKSEYNSLQNIVKNTLRKVNGQLLAYTKAYYQATKKKVETLADITNNIDSIGAAFQSDVVDKYAEDGEINDISYFLEAYNQWSLTKKEKSQLLGLNNILSDYANKYIKTQQRFLKNIYNFRQFFNAPVNWNGRNSIIYPVTVETIATTTKDTNNNDIKTLIYFSDSAFEEFNSTTSKEKIRINENGLVIDDQEIEKVIYQSDLKTPVEYASKNTYKNYFYLPGSEGDFAIEYGAYNSSKTYHRKFLKTETGSKPSNNDFVLWKTIDNINYYFIPNNPSLKDVKIDGYEYEILPITKQEMIQDWLYKTDTRSDLINKIDAPKSKNFPSSDFIRNLSTVFGSKYKKETLWERKIEDMVGSSNVALFLDVYTARFPIDSLFVESPVYTWNETSKSWEEVKNENNIVKKETYSLPFVKSSNYENFFCRKDGVFLKEKWRKGDGKGTTTRNWDDKDIKNNSGFANHPGSTIYAPEKDSYKTYKSYYNKYSDGTEYPREYAPYYRFKAEHFYSARLENETYNQPYSYQDKRCKIIKGNHKINKQLVYKIFPVGSEYFIEDKIKEIATADSFSSIVYYPLLEFAEELNTLDFEWSENQTECDVMDFLNKTIGGNKWEYENGFWKKGDDKLILFTEQDYQEEVIPFGLKEWKDYEKYSSKPLFTTSLAEYKPEEEIENFATGYLFRVDLNNLKPIEEKNKNGTPIENQQILSFDPNGIYYTKDKKRVYTAKQLKANGGTYFLKNNDLIKINLYDKNKIVFNANVKISQNNNFINIGNIAVEILQNEGNEYYLAIQDKKTNISYSCGVNIKFNDEINLTDKTNAFVWSQYHDKTDSPLFEDAARIETQLEEYWLQAYNASKYCEYFLPEHWQPSVSGKTNHFSRMVFNPDTLEINSSIVPQVEMIKKDGSTLLPKYNYTIKPGAGDESLPKICGENEALKAAFDILGISGDNTWAGQPLNITTTYYKAKNNSGTKWRDVLSTLSSGSMSLEHFDGIYPMTFKFLRDNFEEQQLVDYEAALGEHNKIWDNLYKFFPGIILETTYSNPDATTSQDLFTLAKNHFKDLSRPERGYSISVIDAASLSGYKGQELHIGDAIQLDAEEFYDEHDAIKKTLSQYLFITDISYDLRKDSDIQLTVNSIKYQEKLIQRLVKLIK